jgi:hypothetical protein
MDHATPASTPIILTLQIRGDDGIVVMMGLTYLRVKPRDSIPAMPMTIILGPPPRFTKQNIDQYDF